MAVLLMPGIHNSGPTHWQSMWEQDNPTFRRIQVPDWDRPVCSDWVKAIGQAVRVAEEPAVIVAHSLGCLALAEWASQAEQGAVRALMFVSVPDPLGANFPAEASGFTRPPSKPLRFPSIVVSSEDDPFGAPAYARGYADAWGSRFVNIGAAGHINADSGLGVWQEGLGLLRTLRS